MMKNGNFKGAMLLSERLGAVISGAGFSESALKAVKPYATPNQLDSINRYLQGSNTYHDRFELQLLEFDLAQFKGCFPFETKRLAIMHRANAESGRYTYAVNHGFFFTFNRKIAAHNCAHQIDITKEQYLMLITNS